MPFCFRTSIARTCFLLPAVALTPLLHAAGPASDVTAPDTSSIFATGSAVTDPIRDFRYQPEGLSTSSEAVATGDPSSALDAELSSLSDGAGQPPPGRRRSYGRSRYQDRMHNADGSSKIAFVAGAGLNVPNGNTAKFYTPSYTITAGAGINFNRMFGVLGEFHYDHLGVTSGAINTEYNNLLAVLIPQGYSSSDLAGFDANAHVLALTVNPIVNFSDRNSRLGAYITGGAGFYRKTTNFTLPAAQTGCNYYYCSTFYSNYNFDSASANSLGVNGGFGLTYRISEFSSERLFVDARYNWMPISSNNNPDFFPYNRRNTSYIPITVGVRF